MTKEQWIAKYEQKAEPFSMTPGYNLWFRADKGFFLWKAKDRILGISHTSTNDIHFILKEMMRIAKVHGSPSKIVIWQGGGRKEPVYDFSVSGLNVFFANDVAAEGYGD